MSSPSVPAPLLSSPPSSLSSSSSSSSSSSPPTLSQVFTDLESRFFLNLPDEELSSFDRMFFQLQQAHWFYCDFYADRFPSLPKLPNLKTFCSHFFHSSPLLASHLSRFDAVYSSFTHYLSSVPVCGVICLNPALSHVVMVKGWKGNSWGFPRGKLDEGEDDLSCAVRECREEIGFDCSGVVRDGEWLESQVQGKNVKLFLAWPVPESTPFQTQTRKEISAIEWVPIAELPSFRDKHGTQEQTEQYRAAKNKYWSVISFADQLRRWVKQKKRGGQGGGRGGRGGGRGGKQHHHQQQQQQQQHSSFSSSGASSALSVPIPIHHQHQQSHQRHSHSHASSSSSSHSSHPHPRSHSSSRLFSIDSANATTFGQDGGGSDDLSSYQQGWSPEQMFELNEKLYGVKRTVEEEVVPEPENAEEILRKVLGPKYRKSTSHMQQQQPASASASSSHAPHSAHSSSSKHRNTKSELPPAPHQLTASSSENGSGHTGRGRKKMDSMMISQQQQQQQQQHQQQQQQQQQQPYAQPHPHPHAGRGRRGGGRGGGGGGGNVGRMSTSPAAFAFSSDPHSASRQSSTADEELDFGHNPFLTAPLQPSSSSSSSSSSAANSSDSSGGGTGGGGGGDEISFKFNLESILGAIENASSTSSTSSSSS